MMRACARAPQPESVSVSLAVARSTSSSSSATARPAGGTGGNVIEGVAGAPPIEGQAEQFGVREVVTGHARASSSRSNARSLRTARKRCTRTVASLSPSARLTSAVVCSAM
jgi:hypothetical protein